jgi:ADP-heptose:LPS heptosyltransferase
METELKEKKVFSARTLEEVQSTLFLTEDGRIRNTVKIAFVKTWIYIANWILRILRFFMFENTGYDKKKFGNILAYTHGILGDNVVMLPALAALKERFPQAVITVVADLGPLPEAATELFKAVPFVDRLVVLDNHPVRRERFRIVLDPKLKGIKCDLFVDLAPYGNRGWFKAVVREMIFARWVRAEWAIGFHLATIRKGRIFDCIQHRFIENEPRRSGRVLRELGLKAVENIDLLPHDFESKTSVLRKIYKNAQDERPLFIINPGANLRTKQWPAERFALVADWIVKNYDAHVVITGTSMDKDVAVEVARQGDGSLINLAGETNIQELIELLRMAKGCVTNDTGTTHLAAMIGVPTIAIFGTRYPPTWWFPNGKKVVSIFSVTKCRYCYSDYCGTKACLKDIQVDHVIRALEEVSSG